MRLPNTEYTSRPWRVHEIAPDFLVEDVWELPTPGGPDDLDRLVHSFAQGDGSGSGGGVVGFLMTVRRWLGVIFGWDDPSHGLGAREQSVRERLPQDLADGPRGPDSGALPFTSVFQTREEFVAEIVNRTVHALVHLGWVAGEDGVHRAQMTVLVRPNGIGGRAYLALIAPFRYLIVYPRMIRAIGRRWEATAPR